MTLPRHPKPAKNSGDFNLHIAADIDKGVLYATQSLPYF